MGEEAWRVHRAGAPSLDHLRRSPLLNREQVEARLGIRLEPPTAVVAYHPTTIARDPTREADALFSALESVPAQLLFCYPNADAGSRALIGRTESFVRRLGRGRVFVNLDPILYWSLLRCVDLLIGNTYGKYIARDEDIPFVRFGFPIIDRVGHSYFPTVGYLGAMRLAERILGVFMDRQDRDAPEEAFELTM